MKSFLFFISLLFFHYCLAQKPLVHLEVDPKTAEIGEMLTITVKSNVQGEIEIDFPSGFVHGFNVMNGMEQEIDYNTGKVVTFYYLTQTGAMPKNGTFKFGPAYVKKGNKVYKSNSVQVEISKSAPPATSEDITSKQLRQPAFGIIEKSKSKIYEGEPLILNAKVYSQFNPTSLEDYQAYKLDGVLEKHELNSSQRIVVEEEQIRRRTFFAFEYDKCVVFPSGTGKMTVDPFKLILRRGFETIPITSSSLSIEVLPLPANPPKSFIGGVGQFSVKRTIDKSDLKQGDVFTLIVEISGNGNLQNIIEPNLNLPSGFLIYGDPVIKEDFVYGPKGAEGTISYEFNIQITKYGNLNFPPTEIAYFDPKKETYVTSSSESSTFVVEKNEKFKGAPTSESKSIETINASEMYPMRTEAEISKNNSFFIQSPILWLSIGTPIILALIFGFFVKTKDVRIEKVKEKGAKIEHSKRMENYLDQAQNSLNQNDISSFYDHLEKGIIKTLSNYLTGDSDHVLSNSVIFELLKTKNISPESLKVLKDALTTSEHARYGMMDDHEKPSDLLASVRKELNQISRT